METSSRGGEHGERATGSLSGGPLRVRLLFFFPSPRGSCIALPATREHIAQSVQVSANEKARGSDEDVAKQPPGVPFVCHLSNSDRNKKKKKSRGGEPAALFFSAAAAAVARRANSYRLTMRKRTRNSTLVSFPLPNETGTQERFFFFFFSFFAGGSLSFKATRGFPIFSAPLLRPKIELSSAAASACSVCPRSMRRRTATEGDWLSRGRRVSHITFLLLLYPFPEVT